MKKLFALLTLVLGMVSCQTEPEGLDVVVGGEQEVMLSVSLPEGTRANSAEGFNLNELGNYKVRYILEISYNDNLIRDFKITDSTLATFPVRLAPNRDYTFTVWADLVTETDVENWYDADLYYNTASGLENIYFNNWTPNTEARDAWTATKTVTYTSNNKNIGLELKRPFAKVRVVATDIAEIRNFGIKPTNATVEYLSDVYVGFNAVEGKVVETSNRGMSHAFNYADVDTYEDYETSNQLTVFTDYLFVPADGNIKFTLSVYDNEKADALIKKNNFNTTIPVVKNKVTTIKGNVLTEGGDLSIDIENGFDTPDADIEIWDGESQTQPEVIEDQTGALVAVVDTPSDLAWLAGYVNGTNNFTSASVAATRATTKINFVLGADIDLGGNEWTPIGTNAKHFDGTFDGNGHTIKGLRVTKAHNNGEQAALFGTMSGNPVIKNFVIDEAYIKYPNDGKDYYASAVAGTIYGFVTFENITVKNSTITGNNKVGAIFAHDGSSNKITINNCHVDNCYIASEDLKDGGNVGGLIGLFQTGSAEACKISNSSVKNSTIVGINSTNSGKRANSQFIGGILTKTNTNLVLENCVVENNDFSQTIDGTAPVTYVGTYNPQFIGGDRGEKHLGTVTINGLVDIANGVGMAEEVYCIYNANGLKWFADKVNSFELINANVALVENIDLSGIEWTPIGMSTNLSNNETFRGTFDGRNHTISGLTVNQPEVAGLFGYVYAATIKNVTIENANINSNHYAGGVVAWVLNNRGNIQVPFVMENCHVKNSTITSAAIEINGEWDNGDKVGGLVGYACFGDANYAANAGAKISGCSVENTTIKAYRDFAGLVGYASYVVLENCTTNNITLKQDLTHDYKNPTPTTFGLIFGRNDGGNTVDGDNYIADGLYKNGNAYIVKSAKGLVALSSMTIAGGETVKLGADIDLKGVEFNGLNAFNPEPNNTFDGQGYTVSNWTYTGRADDMGFIRNWVGPIKNLTIKNAILRTGGRSAVIVAKPYGNIENCHVVDCNLQANYWACGLIAGMHNSGNMKNCSATNSYIKSTGGTGAITGVLNETDGTRTFTNCTVKGCTIDCTNENAAEPWYAGGAIVGMVNLDYSTIEFNNCQTENNTFKGEFSKDSYYGYSFSPVKINGASVIDTAEALAAAIKAGGEYVLGADIAMTAATYQNVDVTIDGNGHTISQVEGTTNEYALFDSVTGKLTLKNIVFDGIKGGAVLRTTGAELTMDNVTVKNCEHTKPIYGLFRLIGKNTIKNSKFENNDCISVITFNTEGDNNTDPQIVQNCEFKNNTCSSTAVVHYSTGGSATIHGNKFVNNTLTVSNGATVYLGFKKNCTVTNNLFDGNTVTATSKRSAGGLMVGNAAVVTGNAFVNNTVTVNGATGYGNDVCASPYYAAIDLSGNYWGGGAPVENDDYYKEFNNYEVIINDYLTVNPFN